MDVAGVVPGVSNSAEVSRDVLVTEETEESMGELPFGSGLTNDDRAIASMCGRATPLTTRLDAAVG